jgi:hypothetical protein
MQNGEVVCTWEAYGYIVACFISDNIEWIPLKFDIWGGVGLHQMLRESFNLNSYKSSITLPYVKLDQTLIVQLQTKFLHSTKYRSYWICRWYLKDFSVWWTFNEICREIISDSAFW